jgi:hypothetical protein
MDSVVCSEASHQVSIPSYGKSSAGGNRREGAGGPTYGSDGGRQGKADRDGWGRKKLVGDGEEGSTVEL